MQRSHGVIAHLRSWICCVAVALVPFASTASDSPLVLATTTSVRDSGLLDALLPRFTRETGIEVQVIAVGTGAALRMGREGNADVLLTHAPGAERALVMEGIVTRRTPFMENHFVIAGPSEDPADVAHANSPEEALERIARTKSPWVSRSDDSGTHKREKSLFVAAGLDPNRDWEGLVRTGAGMGLSLQVAGERRAYILSDIGTFLAFADRIDLVVLSKPDPALRNVYSILQLDPKRFETGIQSEKAEAFERFLLDTETQKQIGRHGLERFGRRLFRPLHLPRPPANPSGNR